MPDHAVSTFTEGQLKLLIRPIYGPKISSISMHHTMQALGLGLF